MPHRFSATIFKAGINPCVDVPAAVSAAMDKKGYVPVRVRLNERSFRTGLVSLGHGRHRLYTNGEMRRAAGVDVGDAIRLVIDHDPEARSEAIPAPLSKALRVSRDAGQAWKDLTPSRRKEILRYLNYLKGPETLARNIQRVIRQLTEHNNEDPRNRRRHRT